MSAAALYPLLEIVGVVVADIGIELGLTAAAAETAGTIVQTATAGEIGNIIDKAVISILPKEVLDSVDNVKAEGKSFLNDAYALLNPTGPDISYLQKQQSDRPKKNIFKPEPIAKDPSVIIGGNLFGNNAVSDKKIVVIPNDLGISTTQVTSDSGASKDVSTPPIEPVHYDIPSINVPINKTNVQSIVGYIIEYCNTVATQDRVNPYTALSDTIKKNPNYIAVSKDLNDFYASKIPNTEEYQTVAKVYNGRNLTMDSCKMRVVNGVKYFDLTDETRSLVTLKENQGFKIPAIWGNFVGAFSPNNFLQVDILDLFAAFHDKDYSDYGFFDTISDYKLISRISQNYSRIPLEARSVAKVTLLYFSTLGVSAGQLIGSLPKNISRVPSEILTSDDIYYKLIPTRSTQIPIEQYAKERTQFYADLENEFMSKSITSSIMGNSSSSNNSLLAREFGSLLVEIL